jgi:hypothetical protein
MLLRTILDSVRTLAGLMAMKLSPNNHRMRSPPSATEKAASPPNQRGSRRNSASASGHASAVTPMTAVGVMLPLPQLAAATAARETATARTIRS